MAALAGDLPRLDVAARRQFARGVDRLMAGLAMRLSALGQADAEELAPSVFAEMVGALALARGVPPRESDAILAGSRNRLKARLGIAEPTSGTIR